MLTKIWELYDGDWVKDDSHPLYKPGSYGLIDEQFNCFLNGRPDGNYQKLKWKLKGCNLPRDLLKVKKKKEKKKKKKKKKKI
ncbi:Protein trichome birefringence-like 1 [Dionaea muscipula]